MLHQPVLTQKVLEYLRPENGGVFVDTTAGTGGHTLAILQQGGQGIRLFALDRNRPSLKAAAERAAGFAHQATFIHGNFADLPDLLPADIQGKTSGILYDLGLSSYLLSESRRGFSFLRDEKLDMRFDDGENRPTARDLIFSLPADQLADIFYRYGEIRQSRRLARKIKEADARTPVETTGQLAEICRRFLPGGKRINPATRVFQALRIAVNEELDCLERSLEQAVNLLQPGGRLVVIAYHSLEDRIVKHFFRNHSALQVLTKKPVYPDEAETAANPASRSAHLRAAEKTEIALTIHSQ